MSYRQYGFLVGLLIAWLWASTGFLIAVSAVAAGFVGYIVVRALEGDVRFNNLTERFTSSKR
jgi:hypothetical protein